MKALLESTTDLNGRLAHDLDRHFEELVVTFQRPLFVFAYRMCGRVEDAEEIVQDVFVRAYKAIAGYDADRIRALMLHSWLFRICVNLTRNHHRRSRVQTVEWDDEIVSVGEEKDPVADEIQQAAQARELQDLVLDLPPKYRAAILLRFVNELSYPEMAAVLEQPEGTVKSNVHRGLGQLRSSLSSRKEEMP